MHLQNSLTALQIGQLYGDATIKATGAQQRLIQGFRSIGRCQNNHALATVKAIHLAQKLVQRLLTLVVAAELTTVTTLTNIIDFVDENNAGSLFLSLLKQVAHTGSAHAHEHFYEFTAANGEKRHLRFAGHGLSQQCFTSARRPHKQGSLRHIRADFLIFTGVMQKIHQLHQRFLSLILTGNISKALASLGLHINLSITLAKGHGIATHALAHKIHEKLS